MTIEKKRAKGARRAAWRFRMEEVSETSIPRALLHSPRANNYYSHVVITAADYTRCRINIRITHFTSFDTSRFFQRPTVRRSKLPFGNFEEISFTYCLVHSGRWPRWETRMRIGNGLRSRKLGRDRHRIPKGYSERQRCRRKLVVEVCSLSRTNGSSFDKTITITIYPRGGRWQNTAPRERDTTSRSSRWTVRW